MAGHMSKVMEIVMEMILSSSSDSSSSESEDTDDNYNGEIELLLKLLENESKLTNNELDSYPDDVVYAVDSFPNFTDKEFLNNFIVSKQLFAWLLYKFCNDGFGSKQPKQGGGRKALLARKQLLSFLWYIGHGSNTFRDVCDKFHISKDAFSRVIERCNNFLKSLSGEFISWPNEQESAATKQYFYEKSSIPNIIGCIDVAHITIMRPMKDADNYYNEQSLYSIQLQAICDHNGKFLNVFVGYPGAGRRADVYTNSLIYSSLPHLCQGGSIVGCGEYPLSSWCLTPYEDDGNLSEVQKIYNERLNGVRAVMEETFERFMQRFTILRYVRLQKIAAVCDLVLACCVLHNLTLGDEFEFGNKDGINVEDSEVEAEICENGDQDDAVSTVLVGTQ